MAKVFSIFADDRNDHSKMVKQLLSNQNPPVQVQKSKPQPHRPVSASPNIVISKPVVSKSKHNKGAIQPAKDEINKISREDLIIELQEVKRRFRTLEETNSQVKAENQRLDFEATKQQRRIDQLLNLADGAKNVGLSSDIRRDIEKSILVRQLKNQINHLRDDYAEKEAELDALRRNIKSTHLSEIEHERDEYYLEVQRLKSALIDVKEELHRERQRREWNTRVAGDASDDLRKELARLSSGYQNILTNISNRTSSSATGRPATSTGIRGSLVTPETLAGHANRPVSATAAGPFHHQSAGAGSPSKDPERPKRPLSATTRNTPLSTYYQVDNVASVPVAAAIFSDPLDNFGMSGAIATTPLTSASSLPPEIRAHLQKDPASYIAPGADSGVFKIGDRVQGLFQGGPNWYNGTVQSYDAVTGSYAVSYDDGDFEGDVPLARLRAISAAVEAAPVKTHVAVPTLAPAPASHPALVGGAHNFFKPKSQPAPIAVSTLSSPYKVGDKVEALYYKGTTWYGGKVQAVHTVLNTAEEEYAFDIAYDDGDRELKVPQASVRFPAGSANAAAAATTAAATANTANKQPEPASSAASTSSAVPPSPRPPAQFRAGDHVEGFYGGGPSWYGAKVSKVNPLSADGKYTYLLDYNDGDRETAVLEAHIRHVTKAQHQQQSPRSPKAASTAAVAAPSSSTSTSTYKKGDRVQGFFQEYDAWYDGTVDVMNGDGTYHVKYDDGDEDSAAHIAKLRAAPHTTTTHPASPAKAAPASASANATSKFKVDDRVEGLFGGANEWYPAIVSAVERVGASFCYSLHYDDGDREEGVDEALVRALSSRSPQHAALPATAAPFSGALSPKAAADNTNAPSSSQPAARKASIVNTNLDSFLNDLSDDEEESTGGNLDAGKGMMLGGQPAAGSALEMQTRSMDDDGDGYDEDFDA